MLSGKMRCGAKSDKELRATARTRWISSCTQAGLAGCLLSVGTLVSHDEKPVVKIKKNQSCSPEDANIGLTQGHLFPLPSSRPQRVRRTWIHLLCHCRV